MLTSASLNTITPCAACKLLRRRCAQECPFSPYFSPHDPQKFACVHKVFGASNVSKMLMDVFSTPFGIPFSMDIAGLIGLYGFLNSKIFEVPESQRADVANSLVYEANARIRDPVYGCLGIISALQQRVHSLQAELNAIREDIMRYGCTRRDQADPTSPSANINNNSMEASAAGILSIVSSHHQMDGNTLHSHAQAHASPHDYVNPIMRKPSDIVKPEHLWSY